MVQFFNIAKQIRGFSARNSEIEVLGKEIEELVTTLDLMKEDQKMIRGSLDEIKYKYLGIDIPIPDQD